MPERRETRKILKGYPTAQIEALSRHEIAIAQKNAIIDRQGEI